MEAFPISRPDEISGSGNDSCCSGCSYRSGIYPDPGTFITPIRPPCWMDYPVTDAASRQYCVNSFTRAENRETIPGVTVVIPAYREERAISVVVSAARVFAEHVIVVDDGSPDGTSAEARRAGAEVIRLEKNGGKADALLLGLRHARDLGCVVAVTLDGDGQHEPGRIPVLVRPVLDGKADLVIGSRYLEGSPVIPSYRVAGQKMLDFFTTLASGYCSTDSQSGFRALSLRALRNLDFVSSGYCVESDMIAHFADRGLRIAEVPVTVSYGVPNRHKMDPVTHGVSVLAGNLRRISRRTPLFASGVVVFAVGIVSLLLSSLFPAEISLAERIFLPGMMAGAILSGAGLSLIAGGALRLRQRAGQGNRRADSRLPAFTFPVRSPGAKEAETGPVR
jgi:glycosyltransferase involved in cell wall biosynthesis